MTSDAMKAANSIGIAFVYVTDRIFRNQNLV